LQLRLHICSDDVLMKSKRLHASIFVSIAVQSFIRWKNLKSSMAVGGGTSFERDNQQINNSRPAAICDKKAFTLWKASAGFAQLPLIYDPLKFWLAINRSIELALYWNIKSGSNEPTWLNCQDEFLSLSLSLSFNSGCIFKLFRTLAGHILDYKLVSFFESCWAEELPSPPPDISRRQLV
jgi:hypothetical protein